MIGKWEYEGIIQCLDLFLASFSESWIFAVFILFKSLTLFSSEVAWLCNVLFGKGLLGWMI